MQKIGTLTQKANKTIHVMSSGLAYYNYEETQFMVFASLSDVKKWLKNGDDQLVLVEFNDKNKLYSFLESYEFTSYDLAIEDDGCYYLSLSAA